MELNELGIASGLTFAADGMIHAVQPMALMPRKKQKAIHHVDSTDDPTVCLTCPNEDCEGSARCYKKRKQLMEEKRCL